MFDEFFTIAGSNASVLLAPIFAVQGMRVRNKIPKISAAAGEPYGTLSAGHLSVRVLFLGESTIEGVGAPTYQESLAGQTAKTLADLTNQTVHWQAVGKRGATIQRTLHELLPQIPSESFDVAVIALGVNNVLRFHSPSRFQREMLLLISALRTQLGAIPVVLSAVPEMDRFSILPQPLRSGLGLRSRAYNIAMARLSRSQSQVTFVSTQFEGGSELFCEDNFHPSVIGYRQWGRNLGSAIAASL